VDQQARLSRRYSRYAVGLLAALATLHTLDRTLISILIEQIKAEFHLSDSEIGLLTGVLFSIFFVSAAIPFGQVASQGHRPRLLGGALALWTSATMLCGAAMNIWHLLAARIGVAVGEAGFQPNCHSLLADYVEPLRRPAALAGVGAGSSAGVMIGMIGGGYLGELVGWRWTFAIFGGCGLPLVLLAVLTLREPRREGARGTTLEPGISLRSGLRLLAKSRPFVFIVTSATLGAFVTWSIAMWKSAMLMRSFGIGSAETGVWLGLGVGLASIFAMLLGGWLSSRFKDYRRVMLVPMFGWLCATPLFVVAILMPNPHLVALMLIPPTIFANFWYAASYSSIQNIFGTRLRALAAAVALAFVGMIGNGLGPTVVGVMADLLEPGLGKESLRWALIIMSCVGFVVALTNFMAHRAMLREPSERLD